MVFTAWILLLIGVWVPSFLASDLRQAELRRIVAFRFGMAMVQGSGIDTGYRS